MIVQQILGYDYFFYGKEAMDDLLGLVMYLQNINMKKKAFFPHLLFLAYI